MDEDKMKQEMQKPIGAALTSLEWFVLFGLLDMVLTLDNVFATEQDREAVRNTAKRLHNQVFPPKKDNSEEFADVIMLKPKKIIKGPDLIV